MKAIFNLSLLIAKNRPLFRIPFYQFTSSSNPTQVALLEEVEAKVFQVMRSAAKCNQKKLTKTATF